MHAARVRGETSCERAKDASMERVGVRVVWRSCFVHFECPLRITTAQSHTPHTPFKLRQLHNARVDMISPSKHKLASEYTLIPIHAVTSRSTDADCRSTGHTHAEHKVNNTDGFR